MRKIALNINNIGLHINDIINIKLINNMGKPCTTPTGYSFDKDITVTAFIINIELLENDKILFTTSYKLTLKNGTTFDFTVPISKEINPLPHDFSSLLKIGCFNNIINISNGTTSVASDFIKRFEAFIQKENVSFSEDEKDLIDMYIFYANNIYKKDITIDIIKELDQFLGSI